MSYQTMGPTINMIQYTAYDLGHFKNLISSLLSISSATIQQTACYPHQWQSPGMVFTAVCLFSTWYLKTDEARITEPDIQMFHNESWKLIYFAIKRSRSRLPAWVFALLWVLASS